MSLMLRTEWLVKEGDKIPSNSTAMKCISCRDLYAVPNNEVDGLQMFDDEEYGKLPICEHCTLEQVVDVVFFHDDPNAEDEMDYYDATNAPVDVIVDEALGK